MGVLRRLLDRFGNEPSGGKDVEHPNGGFTAARDAMEALLARMYGWDRKSAWATFLVPGVKRGHQEAMIEVADDELNMLHEELPEEIVAAAGMNRKSRGLYVVAGLHAGSEADAKVMADIVDTVFRTYYGAEGDYPLHGRVQS